MKYLLSFILFLGMSPTCLADAKTESGIAKLKAYPPNYFAKLNDEITLKTEKGEDPDAIREFQHEKSKTLVKDLMSAVDTLKGQKKWDADLLSELIRVASLCQKNDASGAVGAILLPLYKKNKKALTQEIDKLSANDAKELLRDIQGEEKLSKVGNG